MKQIVKYRFATLICMLLFVASASAVAPLPGLDLVEPIRKPLSKVRVAQQRAATMENTTQSLATRGLLIVVEFADEKLLEGNTIQAFDSLANGDNYTYNGATGSCKQYFSQQSNGKYIPHFDVVGPVVLPNTMEYYGADKDYEGDDRYVADFVIDACAGADAMGVDFSLYDQDQDGAVDQVYIIYAGYSQAEGASPNTIWPHAWDIQSALGYGNTNQTTYYVKLNANGYIVSQNLPKFDGKTIISYACSNEIRKSNNARSGIGTICHEFCHVLGLADLYVTSANASANSKLTPGSWALMSQGNYLNKGNTPPNLSVWEKYSLGWVEPEMLYANEHVTMPADGMTYCKLNRTGIPSEDGAFTTDTTYYFENRQMTGWDTYLPGHGMLVWQVVYDADEWYNNEPNNTTTRFRLITADGSTPYTEGSKGNRQKVPFPGTLGYTEYNPYAHTRLTNIKEVGGVISFDFINTTYTDLESPIVDKDLMEGTWFNLLGQPIDVQTYKGIAIQKGKKVLLP